jgi:hypothetical protein
LYAIPRPYGDYVAYPLVLLSTYVHEMGHGVAGMLLGATFESFRMYPDASGVALVSGRASRLGAAFVSAGGLVGPAVLAGAFFLLAPRRKLAKAGLLLFGIASLLACVVVVRNPFGWVFVGLLGTVCLAVAWKASPAFSQAALAFLAVQLALSVYSRGDYLFTAVAQTGAGAQPSDVANMADALFLPYWFWGAVCGLFSVAVVALGLLAFWRSTRPAKRKLELPSIDA